MTTEAETPFDLAGLGAEFFADPYPVYARLRAAGPVHRVWAPEGAHLWLVVGYAEARAALADARLSKSWANAAPSFPLVSPASGVHMLNADPPQHTRLRKLAAKEFTPRRVERMREHVQQLVDELVGKLLTAPDGRADLVDALSFPLPMTVICELLGVPFLDRDSVRRWSIDAVASTDPVRRKAAAGEARDYIGWLIGKKRENPGDDLLSALIDTSDDDGDRLSADELMGTVFLLIVAGHETAVNLISNGVYALLRHPDQLALLRADWSLIDDAVEEMLRYDGSVESATFRFATEPVEIAGTTIPAGDAVLVALNAANRDADRFAEPDRFDITRPSVGHLAFGHGLHHCLGAPLARMEARIAIRTLFQRCPDLTLDCHPGSLAWHEGVLIRGPHHLPVRFGGA